MLTVLKWRRYELVKFPPEVFQLVRVEALCSAEIKNNEQVKGTTHPPGRP